MCAADDNAICEYEQGANPRGKQWEHRAALPWLQKVETEVSSGLGINEIG